MAGASHFDCIGNSESSTQQHDHSPLHVRVDGLPVEQRRRRLRRVRIYTCTQKQHCGFICARIYLFISIY